MSQSERERSRTRVGLPPRKATPPFESLRAFDAVARLGGIRKAADGLCRDHAVISRHLRTLEAWLGTTLIERTHSGAVLTEDGVKYHRVIGEAIDVIANATIDLIKRKEEHLLYTWCMPGFAFQWLMARLKAFQEANPNLDMELRPTDMMPDFEQHEADVDIRLNPNYQPLRLSPTVRSIELASPPTILVASPAYLAGAERIRTPADLLRHQLLHEEGFEPWEYWLTSRGVDVDVELRGPRLWHAHLTLDAGKRGGGIALSNHFVAADDIEAGHLLEVGKGLPGFEPMPIGTYLFIARADRWDALPIATFRDWLVKAIGDSNRSIVHGSQRME